MSTLPTPTPEEDEAFSALSRKQERQVKTHGEAWIWLPEGEYTETQLRQLVDSFERMREHHRIAHGIF